MRRTAFFPAVLLILLIGCSEDHLIINSEYRDLVEARFNDKRILASNRNEELFSVFDKDLNIHQVEALKFLYAFMPLSDLADYDGEFFLSNVNIALEARKEVSWGKSIPDYIFLHYVLPPRVNNENLDSFRIAYYDEIHSRINSMQLREAALEINHWCHEKVAYQPADIRTSAPMATILSARGRCGEESTFTVAALRTAGIPARQVYTPRWAHNDDNHAWVEIWDNGEWFYLGACEPEPVLDRGWFTEPARRAMLIHTKSFGAAYGHENAIKSCNNYSEVNNLAKYAVTKRIIVSVRDSEGNPAKDASVEYKLYNYAEFYTLANVPADENGISSLETGFGDLLIWASKDGLYDFRKITVEMTDTLNLVLGTSADMVPNVDLDLGVPLERSPLPGISAELVKLNEVRLNEENLIRQEYTDSWIKPSEVRQFGTDRSIDTTRLQSIFLRSMGNYKDIYTFLSLVPDSLIDRALDMLDVLADKDLRDTKASVLYDHLIYCRKSVSSPVPGANEFFVKYVLNPRVSNENLAPWRSYFQSALSEATINEAIKNPLVLVDYLNREIRIEGEENYYKTPLTPIGVNELKVSDAWSRTICLVAMFRSLGIPSRLEEGRLVPQYFAAGEWHDVYFSDQAPPSDERSYVKFVSDETRPVPEYYIHFTLARFDNGRYVTLEYDFNRKVTDFNTFLALPPGKYMLVTGNRISDSKILSTLDFFELQPDEKKILEIKLRRETVTPNISGKLDLTNLFNVLPESDKIRKSISDKGAVILWIDPEKEPTKHIFNDLPILKTEFDKWGASFIFLTEKAQSNAVGYQASLKGLPENSIFGADNNLELLGSAIDKSSLPDEKFPYVIMIDGRGNFLYKSQGYRIGIGEQILKNIR